MRTQTFTFAVFCLTAIAVAQSPDPPPATPDSYAVSAKIIGLTHGAGTFLPALADALKSQKAAPGGDRAAADLDALAAALLNNADPDILQSTVLPKLSIADYFQKFRTRPDWQYGTDPQINSLANKLYDQAKILLKENPQKPSPTGRPLPPSPPPSTSHFARVPRVSCLRILTKSTPSPP